MASLVSCRWDWCRSTFTNIDALDTHVKHEHIWPMKPMRKADIVLMRRMDFQSLHSTPDTDSNVISIGPIAGVSRAKTPPPAVPPTLTPPQTHSPQRLPASPALITRVGHGFTAVADIFERVQGHEAHQHLPLPSRQRSPTHPPLSDSSGASQEVVEQQLTQEDSLGSQPQPLLPPELPNENEHTDVELTWPTDDESDVLATEGIQSSGQPVAEQNHRPVPVRGQNFRCGSLDVPLGVNSQSANPYTSQGSHSQSQPIVLQTQAPYSSQTVGWSQT